jgi:hypothetical protein
MNFERLHIYRLFDGSHNGTIDIKGEHGKIELNLTEDQIRSLINIVSESLVAAAKEVAEKLTEECITIKSSKEECVMIEYAEEKNYKIKKRKRSNSTGLEMGL